MASYLVTTPIYYVNSDPHIGHAYTNIIADCIKSWHSIQGSNVFLLTGTDEHGQKVQNSAEKACQNTQEFVDHYAKVFQILANKLGISYDDFIRTTEDRHKTAVQALWRILEKNGYIYLGQYEGWYSVKDEAFYDESEIVDGKAPTGAELQWREESSYFFALSKFGNKLLEFYEKNSDFIVPESRRNEIISFVKSGLRDLSISRTNFTWGIRVPNNPEHVIYVWIDALTNYVSALGFPDEDDDKYQTFWKNSKKIHVIGKDISRFHAVYWPAMLMACNLPLPTQLVIHGWWIKKNHEGKEEKMSKSKGNIIDPLELLEKFGSDYTRYFFLTSNSIFTDGEYNEEKLRDKINSDLVKNFGNLIARVTNLVVESCEGTVTKKNNADYENLIVQKDTFIKNYKIAMDNYRFDLASCEIMSFSSMINKFIEDKKPWKLFKTENKVELNNILFAAIDMIMVLCVTLLPFIPQKIKEITTKLNLKDLSFDDTNLEIDTYKISKKINIFCRM